MLFFFAFCDGDFSYICNSLFSQSWCYLVFCSQCQLPTLDNSLESIKFLMWVGSAFCRIFNVFCLPPAVHLDQEVSILCFLNSFWSSSSGDYFFMRKGENLAWQISSKDSITMNPGKSAALFSEFDSDRFSLVFLFEDAIYAVYFSLDLRSTTDSNLHWETHSPWLRRRYATSIFELRVGFRVVDNLWFSALVKFLYS